LPPQLLPHRGNLPRLSQGLWLLGVILFGASIMLIAQIYNIDSHYPNGVADVGAGRAAGGLRHPCRNRAGGGHRSRRAVTGMESLDFNRHFHWPFLLFWLACLPLLYRHNWLRSLHLALIGLCYGAASATPISCGIMKA